MMVLLARSLALPILIVNVLAWPLAYFGARSYLDLFINAIQLPLWPFVACLLFTLVLGWTIASGRTFQAARAKPARLLRQE
jgi:putative ABC transport system permease protein